MDLDGARKGQWCHLELIAEIAAAVSVPVQVGGGARRIEDVEAVLERGVARVLVGTAAIELPDAFAPWTARYGDRLAVSLDARGQTIATRGWAAESSFGLRAVAQKLQAAGVVRFVHTEVGRDGTLRGVDLRGLHQLLPLGLPVLVAGGVGSYRDLEMVRDAGAEGVIVGRALLSGAIDLERAIQLVG
mgnify:CR=1 FL=1